MEKHDSKYHAYVEILHEELIPAMGCTEPIALAYAASIARDTLGGMPDHVIVRASASIIKNVKSVIVPNTDGLKGIPAAAAAGLVAGISANMLEVIAKVDDMQRSEMRAFLQKVPCKIERLNTEHVFELEVELTWGSETSYVHIEDFHTNIVCVKKNGQVVYSANTTDGDEDSKKPNHTLLNMEEIYEFAELVDIDDVRDVIKRQIDYNTSIAEEGLRHPYGANIGKVLMGTYGTDVKIRAKAKAAAASDARMGGCEMPVVINSGSGNQGITASVPVIEYAKDLHVSEEKMYRALVLSNLTTIHLKTGIGTLSAYCGAVSAGAGAGAGIAYLKVGSFDAVKHTVVNDLAIVSGIICDGAKPSCAAKIAASVDAAILALNMYERNQQFCRDDGIVMENIEETIKSVGVIGREGMRSTNDEIIRQMIHE